jgi:galactonate dehydratase
MKIVDVKVTPPLGRDNRNWSLLKVITDEGIVGLGEWRAGASAGALKDILIGRDPMNINRLHHDRLWQMQGTGAGVEIALWDIKGKKLDVPVHELLGGKLRDRVRIYCDCHAGEFWTAEEYARRWRETRARGELDPAYETDAYVRRAGQVVAEGFTAVKFDLDVPNPWKIDRYDRSISRREHEHIVTTIARLREAVGPYIDLAIDLHGAFNLADALRLCKDVEHLDLLWLEDPVRWEWGNVDALAKICMQTETPICTGELFYGAKMFRELLEKRACDLLEPDIPHSGGPIEIRRIAELAETHHMSIAPHYMASAVAGVAAVHICATVPNFLALEYHSHNIPLWSRMLDWKDPIQNGYTTVPDGPGLGVELDEEEIAACLPEGAPLWT